MPGIVSVVGFPAMSRHREGNIILQPVSLSNSTILV